MKRILLLIVLFLLALGGLIVHYYNPPFYDWLIISAELFFLPIYFPF